MENYVHIKFVIDATRFHMCPSTKDKNLLGLVIPTSGDKYGHKFFWCELRNICYKVQRLRNTFKMVARDLEQVRFEIGM